ncbi:MAG: alpha/beta hydrolase [Bacteroidia bacterium]|nr:alpha/beta hydrolase [Bacteroidia bacterium]
MSQGNNIHTNTEKLSTGLSLLKKGLSLSTRISKKLTIKIVTSLFCKPSRQKMKQKHHAFYQQGCTDVLSIRGFEVKVLRLGEGIPVYVSHGWGSLGYNMRPLVEALVKAGHEVILPDLPCHGRSSGTFINQIEMSKVVQELLLHYNAERPVGHIVTHSWGGTATLLAMDGIRRMDNETFRIKSMVSVSMPSSPEAIMDIFCEILGLSGEVRKGLYQNIEAMARKDGRSLEEAFPIGLKDLLEHPEFEYSLIHGMEDKAIPFTNSIELAAKYPEISTVFLEELGHIDILKNKEVHQTVLTRLAAHKNLPTEIQHI